MNYICKEKARRRKLLLVSPDTVQAFIRRVTWAQGVVNCFCNITVKPYKGRKYNPAFVWVCVG